MSTLKVYNSTTQQWEELSGGILNTNQNIQSPIDLTNVNTDYLLQIGQTATITYTNVTSVPLHVTTVEGLYELDFCGMDYTNTDYSGSVISLLPNNVIQAAGDINWSRVKQQGATLEGHADYTTQTSFSVGNSNMCFSNIKISTFTQSKHAHGVYSVRDGADSYVQYINQQTWFNTTTVWSSFGTLLSAKSFSGKIVIRRII